MTVREGVKVITNQRIVYRRVQAKLNQDPIKTEIIYGNKITLKADDEFEYFTPRFNIRGDEVDGLQVLMGNKDYDSSGTNNEYCSLGINPVRESIAKGVVNLDINAPDGGDTRYFKFGGPSATEVGLFFESAKFPTISGGNRDLVLGNFGAQDGLFGFKPSSIRYKDLIGETESVPIDILRNLVIKNFTYKSDEDKVPHIGPIAEDVNDLVKDITNPESFVYKNYNGEIDGVNDNAIIYTLLKDIIERLNVLENPQG